MWSILVVILLVRLSGQDAVELKSPNITADMLHSQKSNEYNIANAVNNFGYKLLLKMMNERKDDNVVVSPTGVAGLLAMALLGSVGRTFDELADALGFSQDIFANRKNHEEFGNLLQSLNSNNSAKTLYGDAIFVDAQTHIRELYSNYLHDVYRGEVISTDFKRSQDAKDLINEWVRNHTEGQIENFLKDSLPTVTKIVLLNALYFIGQWQKPFRPEYTIEMPFKTVNDKVMAEFMLNVGEFPFHSCNQHEFIMIALPYNDSETLMYAIKPRLPKKTSLSQLMNELNYEIIDRAINKMTLENCVVRFPKMKLESSVKLEETLKSMGIREMFTPYSANFALVVNDRPDNNTEESLITRIEARTGDARGVKDMLDNLPNPGLHVDSIIHDVKMTINEYGTEAVAATSGVLARTAEQFYADSPFYIFIRNNRTKLVTFSAVIYNPTI